MTRAFAVLVLLGSSLALAHDVSADLGVSMSRQVPACGTPTTSVDGGTASLPCTPFSGSASVSVSGAYDFNDSWSAWLGLAYMRDLPTTTLEGGVASPYSSGANIFLLNAGAMWIPNDHVSLMAGGSFSPTSILRTIVNVQLDPEAMAELERELPGWRDQLDLKQREALRALSAPSKVPLRSESSSLGVNLSGAYATNGDSAFESTVDATVALTAVGVYQQAELGLSPTATGVRAACRNTDNAPLQVLLACPLVNGLRESLLQARLGAGYSATLSERLDLGLDGAYFVFSKDPNQVGYYSNPLRARDLGSGVPVAPLAFTARAAASYRFSRVTLRLTYQLGVYTDGKNLPAWELGSNHLLTLKTSVKVSRLVRLSLALSLQGDRDKKALISSGGSVVLGALFVF